MFSIITRWIILIQVVSTDATMDTERKEGEVFGYFNQLTDKDISRHRTTTTTSTPLQFGYFNRISFNGTRPLNKNSCNRFVSVHPDVTNSDCAQNCTASEFCIYQSSSGTNCYTNWSYGEVRDNDKITTNELPPHSKTDITIVQLTSLGVPQECQHHCQINDQCDYFVFQVLDKERRCLLKSASTAEMAVATKLHFPEDIDCQLNDSCSYKNKCAYEVVHKCQREPHMCKSCRNDNHDDYLSCVYWDPSIVTGPKLCRGSNLASHSALNGWISTDDTCRTAMTSTSINTPSITSKTTTTTNTNTTTNSTSSSSSSSSSNENRVVERLGVRYVRGNVPLAIPLAVEPILHQDQTTHLVRGVDDLMSMDLAQCYSLFIYLDNNENTTRCTEHCDEVMRDTSGLPCHYLTNQKNYGRSVAHCISLHSPCIINSVEPHSDKVFLIDSSSNTGMVASAAIGGSATGLLFGLIVGRWYPKRDEAQQKRKSSHMKWMSHRRKGIEDRWMRKGLRFNRRNASTTSRTASLRDDINEEEVFALMVSPQRHFDSTVFAL